MERVNMRASTCILLLCTGLVLGQGPPQGGPPPPPPGPADQAAGPAQGPAAPQAPHSTGGLPPPQGSLADHHPPGSAADQNPWHELLHRMMDLMTAAASGRPLPADPTLPGQGTAQGQGQGQAGGQPAPNEPAQNAQPNNINNNNNQNVPNNQNNQQAVQQPPMPQQPPQNKPPAPGAPQQGPKVVEPPRQVVADCFWEGKFYRPGSDIVRGQHDRWCYVTYCDSNGKIQFWDDYNCPPNSMKPTSTHSSGSGRQGFSGGKKQGCHHKGMYYEAGQEIDQHAVGERCYGTYCSHESQVVQWEDWCASGTTVAPTPSPPRQGGGGRKKGQGQGGKGGGRKQGGGGGGGRRQGGGGKAQGQGGRGQGQGQGQGGRQGGRGQGQRQGGGGGGGRRRGPQLQGCYHNGLYYQSNEDVIVGNIGDMCYGYYCEGNNVFVHWEDKCTPTTPAAPPMPTTVSPMGGAGFFFK